MLGRWLLLALALGLAAVANPAPADRVLFIGNSLTAGNDLPLLVEAMAREKGLSLSCETVTYPNLSLEDHWERDTQSVIRRGGFKYVVLQQGPSSLPASRENLREWTRRFGEEIRLLSSLARFPRRPTDHVHRDQTQRSCVPQSLRNRRLICGNIFAKNEQSTKERFTLPPHRICLRAGRADQARSTSCDQSRTAGVLRS